VVTTVCSLVTGIGATEVRVVPSTTDVSDAELLSALTVVATVVSLVSVCVDAEKEVDVIVVVVVSAPELLGNSDKVAFGGIVKVAVVDAIDTTATLMAAHSVSWSPPSWFGIPPSASR